MQSKLPGLFLGIALVVIGALFLLDNFFYFDVRAEYIVSLVFLVGSMFFYSQYIPDKDKVWGLVLGSVCLFVASAIYIGSSYWIREAMIGVFLFAILGTSFVIAYLRGKHLWGLLIPAGAAYTIGLIIFNEESYFVRYPINSGIIFFAGIGLTFALLYMLKNEERKLGWAAFPALGCIILATIIGMVDSYYYYEDILFPTVIIAVGLFLVVKSLMNKNRPQTENNQLPVQ
ncbi:MAG: hypothetical protein GY863_13980 [bacterium]|nr:hypothetical protein [bacterium]